MLPLAYYLLKVMVCSGIMYCYYLLALRNKRFHQYNRFYLLAAVVVSCIIPLMKIDFWSKSIEEVPMVNLLTVVASSDGFVEEAALSANNSLDLNTIALFAYMLISAAFLTLLVNALIRILWLIKVSPREKWRRVYFVFTQAKGTPFSFFRYIFWNERIDVTTKEGNHILQHELAHVHEKHSIDKLLLNIVLVIGWFNPFFWLIQKELNMIHEFIADEKAISDGDTVTFATMLLKVSFPQNSTILANSFFHSPIKRRLVMLTTSQHPRYSYLRRLMLLPLLSILCILFAFKIKQDKSVNEIASLNKTYTVVIDAGHGGNDNGAMSAAGLKEKDIDLQLSTLVKKLNINDNVNILLSRESDRFITPADRVKFAEENKADLFISIHVNATREESDKRGAEIYVSKKNEIFLNESRVLGSLLSKNIENTFNAVAPIIQRQNNGIRVLDENKTCPAILFHCGFISNAKDVAIISDAEKQKDIANGILKAISFYFQNKEQTGKVETLMEESSKEAKDEMHAKNKGSNIKKQVEQLTDTSKNKFPPKLVILDGEKMSWKEYEDKKIDRSNIAFAGFYSKYEKYGEEGKNGVAIITTKQNDTIGKEILRGDTDEEQKWNKPLYYGAQTRPTYPGGKEAFLNYIRSNLKYPKAALDKKIELRVTVRFVVDEDGTLSTVRPFTSWGYGFEEEAIRLIKNSGKWIPAKYNGKPVPRPVNLSIEFALQGPTVSNSF